MSNKKREERKQERIRLERAASRFLAGEKREQILVGQRYYAGCTDICEKRREYIGPEGIRQQDRNLSNRRDHAGFVRKLADQKAAYLLGLPPAVTSDDPEFAQELNGIFDRGFWKLLEETARQAVACGVAYVHGYRDDRGKLMFCSIPPEEVCVLGQREALRIYDVREPGGRGTERFADHYLGNGVTHYRMQGGRLIRIFYSYLGAYPIGVFAYNGEETPLVGFIKSLVDDYEFQLSAHADALVDLPNSILVVRDYGAQDLGELRANLAAYRAVKVQGEGGVEALSTPIDTTAFTAHMEALRRDIFEFGRGVDLNLRMSGSLSGVALKYLYQDLDLDVNAMETEFQTGMQTLIGMARAYLSGQGKNYDAQAEVIFNRDIIINELDAISAINASEGLLSKQTLLANHPWIRDVEGEQKRLEREQKAPSTRRERRRKETEDDGHI